MILRYKYALNILNLVDCQLTHFNFLTFQLQKIINKSLTTPPPPQTLNCITTFNGNKFEVQFQWIRVN